MGLDGGAVDHHERRRIIEFDKSCEHLLPQSPFAPAIEAVEHRGVPPVFVRKRAPAAALAQAMEDAADNTPVVLALGPGVDLRKMRLDQRPLCIVQPEIVRHDSSPPGQLESGLGNQFNWVQNLTSTL